MRRDETRELLAGIDAYVEGLFVPPDPVLDGVLRRLHEAELLEIHVSPSSGKSCNCSRGSRGRGASWR